MGVVIGIIPAAGASIGSWIGYNEAKKRSKRPELFGKGSIEGVIASETTNNAVTGGALIPMMALGIPGSGSTAIIMGGFLIHGLNTGYTMFQRTGEYLLFVGAFAWGTAGVGIATIIAQGISVVLIYYQIRRRSGVHCIAFGETWRDGRGTILSSLNVGFAAGLQSAMISFSNIFVWSYINSFPTPVVAGIGAATKVDRFVMLR